jgi:hypothetical protein
VSKHPDGPFKNRRQEDLAEWLRDDKARFYTRLTALEAAYINAKYEAASSVKEDDQLDKDEGTELALDLCEKWLREQGWKNEGKAE